MKKLAAPIALMFLVACPKDQAKPEETKKPAEAVKPAEPVKPAETATKTAEPVKPAEPAQPVLAAGSGIKGTIKFEGTPPPAQAVDMKKDPACVKANANATESPVEAKDGKLKNVIVYVKSGLPQGFSAPAKTEPATLDQKGCMYEPRVLGVQVGQPLVILNSDPLLHNVHAFAKGGEFNQAMPKPGKLEKKLKKAQLPVDVKCEVHPWMHASLGVFDHPFFAVSDASGAYAIDGLPPGTYELGMWHQTLGEQTASVTVQAGNASIADATFKLAAK
jgi:plastocyanin